VREAACAGRSLHAYREAAALLLRYPGKYTLDQVAEMIVRASTRVAGSSIELGDWPESGGDGSK
jgi:hypothetical protein